MSMLQPKRKPLPTEEYRFKAIGTIFNDAVPIFVFEDVLEEIIDYSERDQRREIGGFLVGGLHEDKRPYVEVRQFVPAAGAESEATSLTFTHESWSTTRQQIEDRFPDDRIVGWHHTHPNMGIFLSEYDRFIHRHFFSQAWDVALVVDPCANEFGFFQWRQNKVVDCGFICVFKEEKK